jgi:hypothetical protein
MTRRAKIERLAVACDSCLEIRHPSQLIKSDGKSGSEVIEA